MCINVWNGKSVVSVQVCPSAAVEWNTIELMKFWLRLAFDHEQAGRASFAFVTEVPLPPWLSHCMLKGHGLEISPKGIDLHLLIIHARC